jgi:flavin-dependent dehydrogenase
MYDILIVGGGLAGLINSILLSGAGLKVLLIEKKTYPFDKVCGEYISNEVVPFLHSINAFPSGLEPENIKRFQLSSVAGASVILDLPQGGFGISRYSFDHFLFEKAQLAGAEFLLETIVQDIVYEEDCFNVTCRDGKVIPAKIVIGSYGKRSGLDKSLNRQFFFKRSPYLGVKYHVKMDFPRDLVSLHNFKGGYCGLAAIEGGKTNLCYLSETKNLKTYGNIKTMEEELLCKNPFLKETFSNCEFISEKPEVINEISFDPKSTVEQHVLMSGDAAGLISPLCGNGMAMAIHSAKILSQLIIRFYKTRNFNREALEKAYTKEWSSYFAWRLWVGRNTQKLFGASLSSTALVEISKKYPLVTRWIIKQTHGRSF